jgi:multisubunit Na+/H+ antiporter MnhC subunit
LPLGSIPALNGVSSSLISAGNAAGLFPAIVPSSGTATPSSPRAQAQGTRRTAATAADSSALAPVLTAQVAGLIALALALVLTVTRRSLTKRLGFKKRAG